MLWFCVCVWVCVCVCFGCWLVLHFQNCSHVNVKQNSSQTTQTVVMCLALSTNLGHWEYLVWNLKSLNISLDIIQCIVCDSVVKTHTYLGSLGDEEGWGVCIGVRVGGGGGEVVLSILINISQTRWSNSHENSICCGCVEGNTRCYR